MAVGIGLDSRDHVLTGAGQILNEAQIVLECIEIKIEPQWLVNRLPRTCRSILFFRSRHFFARPHEKGDRFIFCSGPAEGLLHDLVRLRRQGEVFESGIVLKGPGEHGQECFEDR